MDELKEWLIGNGYKIYKNSLADKQNFCDWYACRSSDAVKECGCNNKPPQIIVKPSCFKLENGLKHNGAEVELIGEDASLWWKFSVYSLSVKELMENLGLIEERLIKAWELK